MTERFDTTRDSLLLSLITACVSIGALVYCFRHDLIMQYGDAVAHINIARRVFDTRWPGPGQLGTVWLPLPHVLMLPFVVSNWAWRTGVGGSIPSMVGYVAGVLGVFRLLRLSLHHIGASQGKARIAAWLGSIIYAANPNLVYVQTTAMGEPIYLAFFIWATVFFAEFVYALRGSRAGADLGHVTGGIRPVLDWAVRIESGGRALRWCGAMLLCAMLSRYDGWFTAAWFGAAAVLALLASAAPGKKKLRAVMRRDLAIFVLLLAVGPAFWLGWNKYYFGNAFEWMNGPYSARAIMQRGMQRGYPAHPGYHSVKTAAVYYVKCAKLNLAGNNLGWGGARFGWPHRIENAWPVLALLGTGLLLVFAPSLWPLLLLWVPLIFYSVSIAYGGVPVFMPVWWPFSFYNVRYGLQMLPAAAVFTALALYFLMALFRNRVATAVLGIAALIFVGVSYGSMRKSGPVCLHEARENSEVRIGLERRIGQRLLELPEKSTLLMQIGYYSGVLTRAGIPLKRTINETDYNEWEAALANPAAYVDYLVAAEGDRVEAAAREHGAQFERTARLEAPGQAAVTIYKKKQ